MNLIKQHMRQYYVRSRQNGWCKNLHLDALLTSQWPETMEMEIHIVMERFHQFMQVRIKGWNAWDGEFHCCCLGCCIHWFPMVSHFFFEGMCNLFLILSSNCLLRLTPVFAVLCLVVFWRFLEHLALSSKFCSEGFPNSQLSFTFISQSFLEGSPNIFCSLSFPQFSGAYSAGFGRGFWMVLSITFATYYCGMACSQKARMPLPHGPQESRWAVW